MRLNKGWRGAPIVICFLSPEFHHPVLFLQVSPPISSSMPTFTLHPAVNPVKNRRLGSS